MRAVWNWLLVENNRKALGFVGAGIAAMIGAAWTVFVYFAPPGQKGAEPDRRAEVTQPDKTETVSVRRDNRDQELQDLLVGTWDGGLRHYPSNISLNIGYTFHPNGTYNWIGEGLFGTLMITGVWNVRDGRINTEVRTSTFPDWVPPGSTYSSAIHELTATRYSYTDNITNQRVTDRRVN